MNNELEIAKSIANGETASPYAVPLSSYYLLDLRITGTGYAYREKTDSYVLRPEDDYLTDDVLAMCNGLPVIMEHPEDAAAGVTDESPIIGTVFYPYIKDDEVWGVCKIWDLGALEDIVNNDYSTSCSFRAASTPIEVDGTTVTKDLPPHSANHVAILTDAMGVWDKCNIEKTKTAINTQEDNEMAEVKDETPEAGSEPSGGDDYKKQELKLLGMIAEKLESIETRLGALEGAEKPEVAAAPQESSPEPAAVDPVKDDAEVEDKPSIEEHEARIKALEGAGIKDDSEAEKEAEIMDDSMNLSAMLGTKVVKPFLGEKSASLRRRTLKQHLGDLKAMAIDSPWQGINIDAIDDSTTTIAYQQVVAQMKDIKPQASSEMPIRSFVKKSDVAGIPDTKHFTVHNPKAYLS